MLQDLNFLVITMKKIKLKYLANEKDGLVSVLNSYGQQVSEIHIPYAPEITGIGFSRYNYELKNIESIV